MQNGKIDLSPHDDDDNAGMADAASENNQNGGRKLEVIRWEKEMMRNTWVEQRKKKF